MRKLHKKHQPGNKFLAQILLTPVDALVPCQGDIHQRHELPAQANWQARIYQDFDAVLRLTAQGMSKDKINQTIWDSACKEQDTRGIVTHKTIHLCNDCASQIASNHAGVAQATLMMMTATLTHRAFLLVSHRLTENAGILGPIPQDAQEKEILKILRSGEITDIHFKDKEVSHG